VPTSEHKTVTKEQCAQVIEFIGRLSQVAQDPSQVRYPDVSSPAISGIPVYANGLRCVFEVEGREFNYTRRECSGMQKHCKTHGYKNPRKKGRPNEETDHSRLWVENQTCQRFFRTGKWQKIFLVQIVPRSGQAPAVDTVAKANEWMDGLFTGMD
jgi:hypothetical protein